MDEIGGPSPSKTLFQRLYWTAQIFGVTAVALILGIVFRYMGGVAWNSNLSLKFHWHPILMVFGMIFLYGNCTYIIPLESALFLTSLHLFLPQPSSSTGDSVTRGRRI